MIFGAHVIVYSSDAQSDRRFFQDVLGLASVDAGDGWLIFELPPAELAVHPGGGEDGHELYFMCADLNAEMAVLEQKGVELAPIEEQRWGLLTRVRLPSGGEVGLYQPKHLSPLRLVSD